MMEDWMPSSHHKVIDFDAEAHKLWKQLNLDHSSQKASKQLANIDAIYKYSTGGTIYVGGAQAAKTLSLLKEHNITSVVNTTYEACSHGDHRTVPNFHEGIIRYCDFSIAHWRAMTDATDKSILSFCSELFTFIEDALMHGESVLIHCLAGAHRAGTTGITCLIHFAQMEVKEAIAVAKLCRPIIDPLGDFPEFLGRLRQAEKKGGIKPFTSVKACGGFFCIFFGLGRKPIKPKPTKIVQVVVPAAASSASSHSVGGPNTNSPSRSPLNPYDYSKAGGSVYQADSPSPSPVAGTGINVSSNKSPTNSPYEQSKLGTNPHSF